MALHHHIAKHKKIIYRVFVVLVVFFVGWGVVSFVELDMTSKSQYAHLESEIANVSDKLKGLGAIERADLTVNGGNGALKMLRCIPDESCPFVSRNWFVPIEDGKGTEFLKGIVKEGYVINEKSSYLACDFYLKDGCGALANKSNVKMSISISKASENIQPNENIAPKKWYQLSISFVRY
ncbi:MAG TPA: hypothetical protein VFO38_00240 [Candidatus Saccharimonadales bacterium]|nr:hypothetical protein [Candidatus Saccharimonadales bacterium]